MPLVALPAQAQKADKKGAVSSKEEEQELNLAVGETKTIPAADVKQYSEGTKGIADFRPTPDGSNFIVAGLKPGSTSLLLINNDGSQSNWVIHVFSRAPELVQKELEQLLDGYSGLRVRRVGSRLFVEGGVATEGDQEHIKRIADLYKGQVESLVTVGTGAIDRKLNIRVDLFFVQYVKNSAYTVGLSWPGQLGGAAITSQIGYDFVARVATAQAALVKQPLPGLDIAASNGWAKVLKQATVITTNGSEATFHNGGELNYSVSTGLVTGMQKIAFGTNVTVLPRYDPTARSIEVRVGADLSELSAPMGSSLPGLQTSRLSTQVFLKLGQALVLSGIRSHSERHSNTGLPFLSEIPLLGVLFGSQHDAEDEVEGAIIIVPSVVATASASASEVLGEAIAEYERFSGDMADVRLMERTPAAQPGHRRGK
ncbi:pilus assembly protein N-terminal domain-containing protein [Sorangium sp. So ce1128]